MENKVWTPTRLVLYPDGHRRWADKECDGGQYEDVEIARHESYVKGAEFCCKVVDEFEAVGGKMVDIFLTRPATYRSEIQDRTGSSIASIHDVIREDLVDVLRDKGVSFDVFTRCDRPKYDLPAGVTMEEEIRSWWTLVNDIRDNEQKSNRKGCSVNLLINYDGALEVKMRQRVLELLAEDPSRFSQSQINELNGRFLPVDPSADILLRTCPVEDTDGFRISSGPVGVLAETNFVIINKSSPDVTVDDIKLAFNKVIEFRTNKIHIPEVLGEKLF